MVEFSVVEPVEKVNTAGTGGGDTHANPPRELRVSARHKRGALFVAHMDEPDPVLLLSQSFKHTVDAVARQSENGVDPPGEEPFHKYIRRIRHLCLRGVGFVQPS